MVGLSDRERVLGGAEAANRLQVQLLETRELDDALRAMAVLKRIPGVDPSRVAVVGHSFGGSLALLIAARDTAIKAAVDFAGGAGSWNNLNLQNTLINAVNQMTSPLLLVFASNDYSVEPGRVLAAELARNGKMHELRIFHHLARLRLKDITSSTLQSTNGIWWYSRFWVNT